MSHGAQLTATQNLVEATQSVFISEEYNGVGLLANRGALVDLDGDVLVDNRHAGLYIYQSDTEVTGSNVLIEGTLPHETTGQGGYGAVVFEQSRLTLVDSVVTDNRRFGIGAVTAEAEVELYGSEVSGTRPNPAVESGAGVVVHNGARAVMEDVTLRNNWN